MTNALLDKWKALLRTHLIGTQDPEAYWNPHTSQVIIITFEEDDEPDEYYLTTGTLSDQTKFTVKKIMIPNPFPTVEAYWNRIPSYMERSYPTFEKLPPEWDQALDDAT